MFHNCPENFQVFILTCFSATKNLCEADDIGVFYNTYIDTVVLLSTLEAQNAFIYVLLCIMVLLREWKRLPNAQNFPLPMKLISGQQRARKGQSVLNTPKV